MVALLENREQCNFTARLDVNSNASIPGVSTLLLLFLSFFYFSLLHLRILSRSLNVLKALSAFVFFLSFLFVDETKRKGGDERANLSTRMDNASE